MLDDSIVSLEDGLHALVLVELLQADLQVLLGPLLALARLEQAIAKRLHGPLVEVELLNRCLPHRLCALAQLFPFLR